MTFVYQNDPCIFCEIVAGRAPAAFVHDDPLVAAFMDIRPINPGHLLIVPKRHAVLLHELDGESAGRLLQVATRLGGGLRRSGVRCEGYNVFLADGEAAGQAVFHVHLHIIPRFGADNLDITVGERPVVDPGELEELAAAIRGAAEPD